jgi:hypothetical protein
MGRAEGTGDPAPLKTIHREAISSETASFAKLPLVVAPTSTAAGILLSGTGHGDRVGAGPKTTGKSEGLGLCFKSLRFLGR